MARTNWAKGRDVVSISLTSIDSVSLAALGSPGFFAGKWRELDQDSELTDEDATPMDSIITDRTDSQYDFTLQIGEMLTNGFGSNIISNFWNSTVAGNNPNNRYVTPTCLIVIREFGEKSVYYGLATRCSTQRVRGVNTKVLTVKAIAVGFQNPIVIQDPGS